MLLRHRLVCLDVTSTTTSPDELGDIEKVRGIVQMQHVTVVTSRSSRFPEGSIKQIEACHEQCPCYGYWLFLVEGMTARNLVLCFAGVFG
jgi:hypothetical protein